MRGLFSEGLWLLLFIPIRLLALSVHECSHGYVSSKLGDPTPRIQGRLTLNPLAHLDFMGTLLMIFTGFGWARPVEVNPMYYKDRKKGMALVAFAGPLSNFLFALVSAVLYGIVGGLLIKFNAPSAVFNFANQLFNCAIGVNLSFMLFNLIPIPPLDGSRILGMFASNKLYYTIMQYERYSMIIIMILSLSGVLGNVMSFLSVPVVNLLNFVINLLINIII